MADLTQFLGGASMPQPLGKPKEHTGTPENQLIEAMQKAGIDPPADLCFDGTVHRFKVDGDKMAQKSGWYIVFQDGIPAGSFGNWKTGQEQNWCANVGRELTPEEHAAFRRQMEYAKKARAEALEKSRANAAEEVSKIWENANYANAEHPYLIKKGIAPNGAKIAPDGRLIVPLLNQDGTLSSIQYINGEGEKRYYTGGATGGKFWMLGNLSEPGPIYIAEGFATAATIEAETGRPCVISYSASNLPKVTGSIRDMYGNTQELVIVADNDESGTGQNYADQASAKHGARVILMPEKGDANDYVQNGGDLKGLLSSDNPKDEFLDDFEDATGQPAPIKYLVKRWLPEKSLVMLHGKSGNGKTFIVLDMVLHIAAGKPDWFGNKVNPGLVIYLAGEGHAGLKGRLTAWKTKHNPPKGSVKFKLSRHGANLDKPDGYQFVIEHLRALPEKPVIIVIDTLHTFLSGDENSSQDANKMLDACRALKREFDCTVLLVHHTGHNDDTQGRARGSSAWFAAMDSDISVQRKDYDTFPITLKQKKSKDKTPAEKLDFKFDLIDLPGWFDDEGEQESSCVISLCEEGEVIGSIEIKKSHYYANEFGECWLTVGEFIKHKPYLTRSVFRDWLKEKYPDKSERTITNMLTPSRENGLIFTLLAEGIIEPYANGWIMVDQCHSVAFTSYLKASKLWF